MRGGWPRAVAAFTAPGNAASSCAAQATWPPWHARCSAVCPLGSTRADFERLLELLKAPRGKNGLWITTVEFGPNEMVFTPPLNNFLTSTHALTEAMITTIHAVPRLLYMRPFKPYFQSGRVEGPDVAKLLGSRV